MIALWLLILVGLSWVVTLALGVSVIRRFGPFKAWAWLALMFGLPWVGLVLYLLFGRYPHTRLEESRYREAEREARAADGLFRLEPHHQQPRLSGHLEGLDREARNMGGLPALGGNRAELLSEHERIVQSLIEDIDRAEDHVHLLFYIFRDDETGRRVAEALTRAAARGVDCRVLADGVGSRHMLASMADRLRREGVEVATALPVSFYRRRLGRFDLRNHRKIGVVDGRIGYVGSWNLLHPSYRRRRVKEWFDLMARVEGPAVLELQLLFLQDWNLDADRPVTDERLCPEPQRPGQSTAQVVPSDPLSALTPIRDLTVTALNRARRSAVLTTPYLIPDETLLSSLWLAVERGIEMHVVVPRRSDNRWVDAVTRSYCRDLALGGVNVYLFQPGIVHAKTLLVDGEVAMVGSANFDMRSFRLNVEANLVVYENGFVEQLDRLQQSYLADSERFDPERAGKRYWMKAVLDDYAKLFSPLF